MVTDEKIYSSALLRYRIGTVLIWLGVLTWLPFIALRVAGAKPSLFWFLPVHLAGVIGGSRIRSSARKEMGAPPPKKSRLRVIGHGLILAGILVWVPYFYSKLMMQQEVDVMNFLPYHLLGILGGVVVLVLDYFVNRKGGTET
jgi:hypothetical protein